ncbi:sugar ABC transporter permease [Halanaerobacter jeridensis]|uniref:sugar ABC transporter permease n=1 Tax=Halanaerobacter jeridensis TaxID=706427 RepID=UPI0019573A06
MTAEQKSNLGLIASYGVVIVMIIIALYPTIWILSASINPNNSLSSSSLIPAGATLDNFKELIFSNDYPFFVWYWNSIKLGVLSSIIAVMLTAMSGYIYAKLDFWGREYGLMLFLVIQMFPPMMAIVAIYVLLSMFGLLDTHTGLLIIYTGGAVPFASWMLKGYFDSIPTSLIHAAKIDGASQFRIFWQIMLPLAKPMLAVVAMFNFIRPFSDFILASLLLQSQEQLTLAVGLYRMVASQFSQDWTMFAAGAVISAIPVMVLFLSMQQYFISGLSAGATKE